VHVTVGPAERDLEDLVDLVEKQAGCQLNPPPQWRLGSGEIDPDPVPDQIGPSRALPGLRCGEVSRSAAYGGPPEISAVSRRSDPLETQGYRRNGDARMPPGYRSRSVLHLLTLVELMAAGERAPQEERTDERPTGHGVAEHHERGE